MRAIARPIGFLICVTTLCILAVAASVGAAEVPTWAIGFLVSVSGEWLIERAVRKSKGEK